jgi:hypothetical protein
MHNIQETVGKVEKCRLVPAASETLPNFDIEGRNFDIGIFQYRSSKLRYRCSENGLRYRVRYYTSIKFDIEVLYLGLNSEKPQYRTYVASISK